jgi:hemerythrin-like domain-containing protein
MHRMLALLSRLREHLQAHGADEQVQQAARDVMRYFDQAAPAHHRDEELHVFPALLAQGHPDTVAIVKRLQHDHLQMESRWAAARKVLMTIASGELNSPAPEEDGALDAFGDLYGGHIEAEEQIAYPAAAALLQGAPLEAMSRDMMARRGLA